MRRKLLTWILAGATCFFAGGIGKPANAALIDFEDQTGQTTYSNACSTVSCPQTVVENTSQGLVTFTGGVILTGATNLPADETSVYGSANIEPGLNLNNPITITFQNTVTNFVVDVINGETSNITYTLADNDGHSSTFDLASNGDSGATLIGFAATGDQITLTSASSEFDMFIDNIQFDVPITCTSASCQVTTTVPEPGSLAILALPLFGLVFWSSRRRLIQM